jgi:hypothetical protein
MYHRIYDCWTGFLKMIGLYTYRCGDCRFKTQDRVDLAYHELFHNIRCKDRVSSMGLLSF